MLQRPLPPLLRPALLALGYVASYVALDAVSYVQPVLKFGITPWNPQAGLTLAFLLLQGWRWAPAAALASLLAELAVRDTPAPVGVLLATSGAIALGYGAAAFALQRWRDDAPLESATSAARFIAVATGAALAVSAAYVSIFIAAWLLPATEFVDAFARYAVGDLNGILTVVPTLLMLRGWRPGLAWFRAHGAELLVQALAVLGTLLLIFSSRNVAELRFFYVLFVPVTWIALRWGVGGAAFALLCVQLGLVIGVEGRMAYAPLVDVQFLMVTLGLTALMLGVVVTERLNALRSVAAREAEQRAFLAAVPDAVLVSDATGAIVGSNQAAERLFERPAAGLRGERLAALLPGLATGGEAAEGRGSLVVPRAAGAFPADVAWSRLEAPAPRGVIVVVRDVTERHSAEARLKEHEAALGRAMRFAVAGELSSALTHELNQPITALLSYLRAAELLAAPLAERDARLVETLGKGAREAVRAADVIRRLRDFYRGGAPRVQHTDVEELGEAVIASFDASLQKHGIALAARWEAGTRTVVVDRTQLEMVLHNLVGNAVEALAEPASGAREHERERRIEVGTQARHDGLRVTVDDSGPGVSQEVADRLFEPFLTTKPEGMGLGLALSRSLLRSQGGDLWVEPSALGGARFVVRLPLATGGVQAA